MAKTRDKILKLLEKERSPKFLIKEIGITRQGLYLHLSELLKKGEIKKIGKAPKVYYIKSEKIETYNLTDLEELKDFIFQHPTGYLLHGTMGFVAWSENALKGISINKKIEMYKNSIREYESRKSNGVYNLEGKFDKIKEVGENIYLSKINSLELRSIKDFGRTRLAVLLDVSKASGDKKITGLLLEESIDRIKEHSKNIKADAIAFVPPTEERKNQIMFNLKNEWKYKKIPIVNIEKIPADAAIPQKKIKDIKARLENAQKTFYIEGEGDGYKRLLLIDDLVGSGATMNQIAKNIINKEVANEIYALAIVGEEKGFSVQRSS